MILCNTDEEPEKEKNYIEVLLQKRVDGVVIAPVSRDGANLFHFPGRAFPAC